MAAFTSALAATIPDPPHNATHILPLASEHIHLHVADMTHDLGEDIVGILVQYLGFDVDQVQSVHQRVQHRAQQVEVHRPRLPDQRNPSPQRPISSTSSIHYLCCRVRFLRGTHSTTQLPTQAPGLARYVQHRRRASPAGDVPLNGGICTDK